MKKLLRHIGIIRWADDLTDRPVGKFLTALAVVLAIAMFCYWRAMK